MPFSSILLKVTLKFDCKVFKKIVLNLCGCCEGAVLSIILSLMQLHEIGFNLEPETLFVYF